MAIAYIGLGSNLESPKEHVCSALKNLDRIHNTKLLRHSSLYKTKAIGATGQDDYINAVAKIESTLEPLLLLDELQYIEYLHKRERRVHWGARTLDLDLLLYDKKIIKHRQLTVPHQEIHKRRFVLEPLVEIEPDCIIPNVGPVNELLDKVKQQIVSKV